MLLYTIPANRPFNHVERVFGKDNVGFSIAMIRQHKADLVQIMFDRLVAGVTNNLLTKNPTLVLYKSQIITLDGEVRFSWDKFRDTLLIELFVNVGLEQNFTADIDYSSLCRFAELQLARLHQGALPIIKAGNNPIMGLDYTYDPVVASSVDVEIKRPAEHGVIRSFYSLDLDPLCEMKYIPANLRWWKTNLSALFSKPFVKCAQANAGVFAPSKNMPGGQLCDAADKCSRMIWQAFTIIDPRPIDMRVKDALVFAATTVGRLVQPITHSGAPPFLHCLISSELVNPMMPWPLRRPPPPPSRNDVLKSLRQLSSLDDL